MWLSLQAKTWSIFWEDLYKCLKQTKLHYGPQGIWLDKSRFLTQEGVGSSWNPRSKHQSWCSLLKSLHSLQNPLVSQLGENACDVKLHNDTLPILFLQALVCVALLLCTGFQRCLPACIMHSNFFTCRLKKSEYAKFYIPPPPPPQSFK